VIVITFPIKTCGDRVMLATLCGTVKQYVLDKWFRWRYCTLNQISFPKDQARGLTLMPTYAYSLAASIKRLACNTLISLVGRVGLEPTTY